jgi:hypothetical protein
MPSGAQRGIIICCLFSCAIAAFVYLPGHTQCQALIEELPQYELGSKRIKSIITTEKEKVV